MDGDGALDPARMAEIVSQANAMKESMSQAERTVFAGLLNTQETATNSLVGAAAGPDEDEGSDSSTDTVVTPDNVVYRSKIPKPDRYSLKRDDLLSFEEFLKEFEKYCRFSCGQEKRKWLRELGNYLTGQIAKEYSGYVSGKMPYEDVKNRLLAAVAEYRENRMDDGVAKFHAAKMGRNEGPLEFAIRLEVLARELGTNKKKTEEQMEYKFMHAMPRHLRKSLKERLQLRHNMAPPSQSKWTTLFKLLRADANSDSDESDVTEESDYAPSYRSRTLHRRKIHRQDGDSSPLELFLAGRDQPTSNGVLNCRYCKRRGHDEKSCRRKNGLCLSCGAANHQLEQCSTRRPRSKSPAPSRRASSNNRSCFLCGVSGHIRSQCPQLRSSNEAFTPTPPAATPNGQATGPTAPYVTMDVFQDVFQQFAESIRTQIANLAPMLNSNAPRNQGHAGSM